MTDVRHQTARSPLILRLCARLTIAALLFVGSQSGHLMLIEHVRCAEHGELAHGTAVHHPATPEPSNGVRSVALPDHRPADAGAHEHCALTADRREAILQIDHAGVAAARLREERMRAPEGHDRDLRTGARFRIAPKTSPPA
ncbi:MAG: hypothetical protein OEV36_11305 [Myxococcales bacterium]|nr:hypothetical protein [Myxococcales bacterium]